MTILVQKFKQLFLMIKPTEAFINSLVVCFSILFISEIKEAYTIAIGGFCWLFISFANHIIKEYYETMQLKLIFPGNILIKEIISPVEAMAYYTYFSISAFLLASYLGTFTLIVTAFVTLFNHFSCKKCRKNPYRFPFSRGIIAGLMILFSAIHLSNIKMFIFPAALFCLFTYIISYLDYSRYYEEITDKSAKSFLSLFIPFVIFISALPYLQKTYNLDYLMIILITTFSLVYVLMKVQKGYRNTNINRLVWILRFNLMVIIIAVYAGLQ